MLLKQIIWRIASPLTIILFGAVTKWWYVLPVDAPDTIMIGFPFPFVADGWFTSMSLQFFVMEFMVDFACYFLCCFAIAMLFKRFLRNAYIAKYVVKTLWTLAILISGCWFLIFSISEKHIGLKRDWDMQVLETGCKFTWMHTDRPELSKYQYHKN